MGAPEFIYLNGQAVRVTSWQSNQMAGTHTLVVIARGSADRDQLLELLASRPLLLALPGEEARPVSVRDVSVRSTGAGQQAVHRIVALIAWGDEAAAATDAAPSVEYRLASIERKLDEVLGLLRELRQR